LIWILIESWCITSFWSNLGWAVFILFLFSSQMIEFYNLNWVLSF
jgi:hypothetical protein